MSLSEVQKAVLEAEVREAYLAYQKAKEKIATEVKLRVEREIAAEQGDALRDLSRILHAYHQKGLPKSRLRVATKKYGNNDEFLKLWNAFTPQETFTLAPGRNPDPKFRLEPVGDEWWLTAYESHQGKKIDPYRVQITAALKESVYKKGEPYYNVSWGEGDVFDYDRSVLGGWAGLQDFVAYLLEEVARLHTAGEIPDITDIYEHTARLNEENK